MIYIERDRLFKTVKNGEEDITEETQYETGCVKIYLNTTVDLDTVEDKDLRAYIQFINTGIATNDFTKEIENTVIEQKKDSVERRRYMTFQQELQKSQKEWYKQGVENTNRIAVIGFYEKGSSVSDIAEVLHLSIEQVEKILSSNSDDSNSNENN